MNPARFVSKIPFGIPSARIVILSCDASMKIETFSTAVGVSNSASRRSENVVSSLLLERRDKCGVSVPQSRSLTKKAMHRMISIPPTFICRNAPSSSLKDIWPIVKYSEFAGGSNVP